MDARVPRKTPVKIDRKQAILQAAEKLFAQAGYGNVSIRQIAQEAGVPLALVGYYYGQKHELFRAVFAHWEGTITQRLTALGEVMAQPHSPAKLHRIIEAFVTPVLSLRASVEGEHYARMMTHSMRSQRDEATDAMLREYFDPMAQAFIEAIRATLAVEQPGTTRGQVAWCYQFALGALLNHINDVRVERLSGGANRANDPAAAPLLVDFIVHGIRGVVQPAPAPATPLPATRRKRP